MLPQDVWPNWHKSFSDSKADVGILDVTLLVSSFLTREHTCFDINEFIDEMYVAVSDGIRLNEAYMGDKFLNNKDLWR